jgi:hypothetical protein
MTRRMSMDDWDNLVEPTRDALEALLRKGDAMADRIEELEAKLAKAVVFAEIVERTGHGELEFLAGDMLAELKGQNQ